MENNEQPKRESINDMISKYKESTPSKHMNDLPQTPLVSPTIPKSNAFSHGEFEKTMSKETDPDLMTSYEIIKLPSKGLFYENRLSEVAIEYMTSRDEDLLTTPSLIENGTVLDVLLKRKIKTPNVIVDDLLIGDKNALLLFLRTSSYGSNYKVQVTDPRNNTQFTTEIDLLGLKYVSPAEQPDEQGHFNVELPMRKKTVKFKLLTTGEDNQIFKKAEAIKEAYNEEISQFSTLKLKASVISIDGNKDRSYIDKFIDAMPALDALTIRRKITDVSPDVDMKYTFTAKDGYKFEANLVLGIDFFFPNI